MPELRRRQPVAPRAQLRDRAAANAAYQPNHRLCRAARLHRSQLLMHVPVVCAQPLS